MINSSGGIPVINKIKYLNNESFKKYGNIIEFDNNGQESFQIILNEENLSGWRIAVSKITRQSIKMISRHPDSRETFEPVEGVTLLYVALPETPEKFEIFLLEKPVCIYKNIWHSTICLSEYSIIKIAENNAVGSESFKLENELEFGILN
jgi:ureidoglycolate hydrolase